MRTIFLFLIAAAGFVGSIAWADEEVAVRMDLTGLVCELMN